MIIVTGGAGFIGSNIVKALNAKGIDDILVVDDLSEGIKFNNLVDCQILDYINKDDFFAFMLKGTDIASKMGVTEITAIFHQGACSTTTEWNGRFMMQNNYEYSKQLLRYCLNEGIPFIYASSAAVYGASKTFREALEFEKPLNMYGYSKFQFDQYVRRILPVAKSQIVGLRYFNVYGPREFHKGTMASVAWHNQQQLLETGTVKLFEGCEGYGPGEQRRDFIFVDDAVAVNLWFLENTDKSGIFNVGTGRAQTFNEVARSVIAWHQRGNIEYIPFPTALQGRYQSFTQADISLLRQAGYTAEFKTVQQGVAAYLDALKIR